MPNSKKPSPAGRGGPPSAAAKTNRTAGGPRRAAPKGRPGVVRGPGGDANAPRPKSTRVNARPAAAPARTLEGGEFVQQDGSIVFIPSGWRRKAAVALTAHGLRWRYRDFTFPLITEKGHELEFTPDFLIYDDAPKVVRIIIVPGGGEDRTAKGKAGLFKAQYRSIAVEVWDARRLEEMGLL